MGVQESYDGPSKVAGDEEVATFSIEGNIQPDWTEKEEERLARRDYVNLLPNAILQWLTKLQNRCYPSSNPWTCFLCSTA